MATIHISKVERNSLKSKVVAYHRNDIIVSDAQYVIWAYVVITSYLQEYQLTPPAKFAP